MPEEKNDKESLFLQKLAKEESLIRSRKKEVESRETKKSKKIKKLKSKKRVPAVAIFATTFILFLVVVVLLIFTLSIGGAENPVIQFFGQNEDTVKQFLLRLVNGAFGFLSVFLLILISTMLFFGFTRKKNELQKRSIAFLFSVVSLALQFVTILVWLGMYNFVSAIEVQTADQQGEIVMYIREGGEPIRIMPDQLSDKYSPLDLIFSVEDIVQNLPVEDISFYAWDFNGDGVVDHETPDAATEYRINRYGSHTITVLIYLLADDKDAEQIIEKTVSFEIPRGTFRAMPNTGPIPLEVAFDASQISQSYGSIISEYEWDFNDDNIFEELTFAPTNTHVFKKIGTYTINLRTVNQNQTIQNYSTTVTTTEEESPITVIIQTTPELPLLSENRLPVHEGSQVVFNAEESWSKTGEIVSYEWSFPDTNTKDSGALTTHTFYRLGEWDVDLLLQDEGGKQITKRIRVVVTEKPNVPQISLSTNPKLPNNSDFLEGKVPFTVSFDASRTTDPDGDDLTFEWDFNSDGRIDAQGEQVEHTYDIIGEYEVILAVRDGTGESDKEKVSIRVLPHELNPIIHADTESAHDPCIIELDGSLSYCTDCKILAYEWDFGDGNKTGLTSATVRHPYDEVGEYLVTLRVHTNDDVAETTKKILCLEKRSDACFTASRLSGSAPLKSRFDPSCTAGTIENWSWDFGDGETSQEQLPTHTFISPGIYPVELTIIDANKNIDTYVTEIIVK